MLRDEYERPRRLPRHLRPTQATPEFSYSIRAARHTDLPSIREIHTHYVRNSAITLDAKQWTVPAWRAKFDMIAKVPLPFLVATAPSGEVIGYAFAEPWEARAAARKTVAETSIYLGPGAGGKGLGRALLAALIEACRTAGVRRLVAVVSDHGADASLALHRGQGFVEVGRMGRIGFRFGRWLGLIQLELSLSRRR